MTEIKQIMAQLKEVISEHLGIDSDEITASTSFKRDLGMDSLDVAEMWVMMERRYMVRINDVETEGIDNIKEAAEYLFGRY